MLLETLDIKHNDILIYSQNIFDLENNFKIIYKDDPEKIPHKISYGEVCRFVNEFNPKNLIVYRLLTNIPDFEIFLSKYGFFININSVTELIYFDPVFAVKELEEYSRSLNFDLRFRIQQVGLTTLNRYKNLPNFAEIYNVDLQASEAKNQNDKVFADAIFSVRTEVPVSKPAAQPKKSADPLRKNTEKNTILKTQQPRSEVSSGHPAESERVMKQNQVHDDIQIIRHDLSEDKDFDYKQIMKINYKGASSSAARTNFVNRSGQQPRDASNSSFGKFLQSKQINQHSHDNISLGDVPRDHLRDIFKSPSSLKNLVEGKEDKKIVLKLDRK